MWNADFLDVKSMDPVMSVDDKIALKSMKDSVKLVNGKYQLGIPWRMDPETSLPNNRSMAESRLRMLKRKFSSDPKLAEDYTTTVETYISMAMLDLCQQKSQVKQVSGSCLIMQSSNDRIQASVESSLIVLLNTREFLLTMSCFKVQTI